MNTKTVKEKLEKIMVDYMRTPTSNSLYVPVKVLDKIDKLYRKEVKKIYEEQMPETILDDDIADWEHDNLESK